MTTKNNNIVISFSIAIFLLLAFLLLVSYNSKCQMNNVENFYNNVVQGNERYNEFDQNSNVMSSEQLGHNEVYQSVNTQGSKGRIIEGFEDPVVSPSSVGVMKEEPVVEDNSTNDCYPKDRLTASDLLPKSDSANSRWAQLNPSGTGDLNDQNYLTAGYHIGVNTVGQSLRNANLQLRSEPPNPQVPVSPWGISTITNEGRTKILEIGSAAEY